MKVTKITIDRLYSTGSYSHVKFSLTAELKDGDSATKALVGLEKILNTLNPNTSTHSNDELRREEARISELKAAADVVDTTDDENEFRRKHGHFVGTPREYATRCEESHMENVLARAAWEKRCAKARLLLDDLGGAAEWKDAKLDWDNDDQEWED